MTAKIEKHQLRDRIHEIVFEADTKAGKTFDVLLIVMILLSIITVFLESMKEIQNNYGHLLYIVEWCFTIVFSIEYLLRLYCVRKPFAYATSFLGIIDLMAILPTYISFLLPGAQILLVIRILRLMRVFRIFKLAGFLKEGMLIMKALKASKIRITVFLFGVILLVTIIGAIMYLVEGGDNPGFSSIPRSIYWAIVTLTTVGFGDITPQSSLGQFLSAIIMIMGYAIIAVPTGIVTAEMTRGILRQNQISTQACRNCGKEGHETNAKYCKFCGHQLNDE